MLPFTDANKFAIIKWRFEEDGSDAEETPLIRAAKFAGLSRTKASQLLNNHREGYLKDKEKIKHFELAFAKVAPGPGSGDYQAMCNEVKTILSCSSVGSLEFINRYFLDLAYFVWAAVALDPSKTSADRILYGKLAQHVMFYWLRLRQRQNLGKVAIAKDDEILVRGRKVIDAIFDLLEQHRVPPSGLFDEATTSLASRKVGYKILRMHLQSDQIGWYASNIKADDEVRAGLYARAYKAGIANDLMWLHGIFGKHKVGYSNNAWNLAVHAGAWSDSVRYGAELFKAHPSFITQSVQKLTPVNRDRSVWPGIAAIMVDTQHDKLDHLRQALEHSGEPFVEMMTAVQRMLSGIMDNRSYIEVLEMGENQ